MLIGKNILHSAGRNGIDDVRRMRELIGLPVLDTLSGRELGGICDVLFDEQANRLLGVVTDTTMRQGMWLARKDIESISPLGIVGAASLCRICGRYWSDKVGTQIYEQEGRVRGTVAEVYVNEDFREVLGYEMSDGVFPAKSDGYAVFLDKDTLEDFDKLMERR